MKNLSLSLIISTLFLGLFSFFSTSVEAKKIEKKTVWTFTNSTGEDANDLHMELQAGCLPTNIITDDAGIRRAGGIFTDFPNQGSPSHHDYDGGTVADGESITLQFDTETKPKKWWWTKDGERIGDIEYANSDDLASYTPQSTLPDYLEYTPRGTGRTTGHIATLSVHNPTLKPVTLTVPVCFITSDGFNQCYVVVSEVTVTVGINQTVSIPLEGYCADIYKPAVPNGASMPDVSEWIFEDENYLSSIPESAITGEPVPSEISGGITPTIPGTNTPITAIIDQFEQPELFAQLSIAAFKKLKENVAKNGKNLVVDPESTVQQSGWIFTAALRGDFYKVNHLFENAKRQKEKDTGVKHEKSAPEEQKSFEESVTVVYTSFKLIGAEAKIFNISDDVKVDPDDVDDPSDLPTHIRRAYNRYAVERDVGRSHNEALQKAFRAPGLRDRWGPTFKRLYE